MFSLESPHRGDSNEYTQYTIFKIYSQGRVKHDMRIAKKTRYKRVQNALISIAFLRFANALTNAPIKWLHKNAKIAFVRVFRFSQSELRFHFAFLRANAFAI